MIGYSLRLLALLSSGNCIDSCNCIDPEGETRSTAALLLHCVHCAARRSTGLFAAPLLALHTASAHLRLLHPVAQHDNTMAAQTNAAEALAGDFAAAIARGEPCYAAGAAAGRFELSSFLEIAQTDDGGMCSATMPAEGGVYAGGVARRDVSLPLAAIVAAAASREATHGDLYAMQVPLDGSGPLRRAMARAAAAAVPFGPWRRRRHRPPTQGRRRRVAAKSGSAAAPTTTTAHYDGLENFMIVTRGRKTAAPWSPGCPARLLGAGLGVSRPRRRGRRSASFSKRATRATGPRAGGTACARRCGLSHQRLVARRAASACSRCGAARRLRPPTLAHGSSSCGSRRPPPTPQPTLPTTGRRAPKPAARSAAAAALPRAGRRRAVRRRARGPLRRGRGAGR